MRRTSWTTGLLLLSAAWLTCCASSTPARWDHQTPGGGQDLLVVEAKNADWTRGFKQLAVELVALDQWASDSPESRFYGAVSVGEAWKIGFLDRQEKRVVEDLNLFLVPRDLVEVVQILAGILTA